MPSYQPGLGVEVGRLGQFTDHRGRFEGAYRSLNATVRSSCSVRLGWSPVRYRRPPTSSRRSA